MISLSTTLATSGVVGVIFGVVFVLSGFVPSYLRLQIAIAGIVIAGFSDATFWRMKKDRSRYNAMRRFATVEGLAIGTAVVMLIVQSLT